MRRQYETARRGATQHSSHRSALDLRLVAAQLGFVYTKKSARGRAAPCAYPGDLRVSRSLRFGLRTKDTQVTEHVSNGGVEALVRHVRHAKIHAAAAHDRRDLGIMDVS